MSDAGKPLSKNAQKRLAKQKKKAEEKAKKEAAKAAKAAALGIKPKKKVEDPIDPTAYYENRSKRMEALKKEGKTPYPHKFSATMSIPQFRVQFDHYKKSEKDEKLQVNIAGRISSRREMGKALLFYTIQADNAELQIFCNKGQMGAAWAPLADLRRGDIIGVVGNPGRTRTEELSLFAKSVQLLSPCLHMLPSKGGGLVDKEIRYRQRYLDLMLNHKVRNIFYTRSKIVNFIRRFLDERGFLEVETPMMNMIAGGATAKLLSHTTTTSIWICSCVLRQSFISSNLWSVDLIEFTRLADNSETKEST
jgi:lysyl-tRNA synthetase class 2